MRRGTRDYDALLARHVREDARPQCHRASRVCRHHHCSRFAIALFLSPVLDTGVPRLLTSACTSCQWAQADAPPRSRRAARPEPPVPSVHRLVSQPAQVRSAAGAVRERAEEGPRNTRVITSCSFRLPTGVNLLAEMATTDECSSNDTTKRKNNQLIQFIS